MAEYIEKWSVVNRLIDLENEFQQYKPFHGFEHAMYRKICEAEIAIGKAQAADVAPVRRGSWSEADDDGEYTCSHCGWVGRVTCLGKDKIGSSDIDYCPYCGAEMRGRNDE